MAEPAASKTAAAPAEGGAVSASSQRCSSGAEAALLFWLTAATGNAVSASREDAGVSVAAAAAETTNSTTTSENALSSTNASIQQAGDAASAATSSSSPSHTASTPASASSQHLLAEASVSAPAPRVREAGVATASVVGEDDVHTCTAEARVAPPNKLCHMSSPRSCQRLVVHDVMPLFDALLVGQLGPVVIDIQLQGHARLLQHPQRFEATLQDYAKQSTGPLKEALNGVQPFFLLCNGADADSRKNEASAFNELEQADGTAALHATTHITAAAPSSSSFCLPLSAQSAALYTMDPSNHYPVVPLLAQLLRSPNVTKVLLHSRLLYRLLFLFLGTDRLDLQCVVDVATWSELGRQLRPSLVALHPIPVNGVAELADVQSALSVETRGFLDNEVRAMAQKYEPAWRQPQHHLKHSEAMAQNGTGGAADVLATREVSSDDDTTVYSSSSDSSSYQESHEGSSSSGDDDNCNGEENEKGKGEVDEGLSTASIGRSTRSREANNSVGDDNGNGQHDAVALLQSIVPIAQQPLNSDSRRCGCGKDSAKRSRSEKGIDRVPHQRKPKLHLHHRVSSADTAVLTNIYHGLKVLTLFYTEVLPKFFDNVTGVAGAPERGLRLAEMPSTPPATTTGAPSGPALRYRLSPSEWCVQRTYAAFLCEVMSYHGVFVNDGVFFSMSTVLDVQLRAVEDVAEHVLAALHERTSHHSSDDLLMVEESDAQASTSTCMNAAHFRRCIARVRGAAAPLMTHPKLDFSLLRALAEKAAAAEQDAEAAAQLRLSCQLVCIWIAFQERTEAKQKLTDMFSKVADRLQARVLERSQDSADTVDRFHAPSSWSEVCFSVHPTWTLHNASTGRIFSTAPNVQNLSKQPQLATFSVHALRASLAQSTDAPPSSATSVSPQTYGAVGVPSSEDVGRWMQLASPNTAASTLLFPEKPQWTLRHLYRAPPGCILLSFDFNQLELRVLAQLSGDAALQRHLSADVDVLTLTTAAVLRLPSAGHVQPHQRQAVKVIVYGLLYGMGPKTMEERIQKIRQHAHEEEEKTEEREEDTSRGESGDTRGGRAVSLTAHQLIARFHQVYPRVESYLRETRQDGLHLFSVETLSGRKSLADVTDANRRKQRAVAQAIQGGAADIVLCAMRAVHQQRHALVPYLPAAPFALLMTIHDELVYAVPRAAVDLVACAVKRIMEDQARVLRLAVPLPVTVRAGDNFGALEDYRSA